MGRQSHFCEVFYDDVRIPLDNVVGSIGEGWSVAQTTLSFERGVGFLADQLELARVLEDVVDRAKRESLVSTPNGSVTPLGRELARLRARVIALGAMARAFVERVAAEPDTAGHGMLVRVCHAELAQQVHEVALDVLGPERLVFVPWSSSHDDWTGAYLRSFGTTIGGGTMDITRNLVAERVLDLPRGAR